MLWKDERDEVFPDLKSDLRVRYSANGGLTWSDAEFATDVGDLETRFANINVGVDGAPYVIWSDLRNGTDMSTLFVKRRAAPTTTVPAVSGRNLAALAIVLLAVGIVRAKKCRVIRAS